MLNLHNNSGRRWAVAAILIMGGALLLNGCESDSVAPDDGIPQLTERDVAGQAGAVAAAMAKVSPEILRFSPTKAAKELGIYPYDFPGNPNVTGEITLEFFTGGAGGTHVVYDEADYGLLYTDPGEMLHVEIEYIPGEWVDEVWVEPAYIMFDLGLDIQGNLDRDAGSAVVSGTGTFVSGPHPGSFQLTGLGVSENGAYPTAGTLMFTAAGWTISVVFDGDETADVLVDGVPTYVVNMDTGWVTVPE